METRSHLLLVSTVVVAVFAALIAFAIWITPSDRGKGRRYDILFAQSVSGLIEGSPVSFAGIPVGRVQSIALDNNNPNLVRVRVNILSPEVPIVEGTTASLKGDLLFGTSLINLEGPEGGVGRPLLARGEDQLPVIAAKKPGFGELANDPTPLVESIAAATDRLLDATTPEGRREISARLDRMAKTTAAMAAEGPALDAKIALARSSLRGGASAASASGARADAMARQLETKGAASMRALRTTVVDGRGALDRLDASVNATRPGLQGLTRSTQDLSGKIEELRTQAAAVGAAADRIDRNGIGPEPALPDHKPKP